MDAYVCFLLIKLALLLAMLGLCIKTLREIGRG